MKYVFRVLSTKVKESLEKKENGIWYYKLPITMKNHNNNNCTEYAYIPTHLAGAKGDKLYFFFDGNNEKKEILLNGKFIHECTLLDYINRDYLSYILNVSYYNPLLSHSINNIMPIGIQEYNELTGESRLDKWSNIVNKISKVYNKDLVAISPTISNKIYPFHYQKFPTGQFVREYLGNIILFSMQWDNKYIFMNKPDSKGNYHIYYLFKDTSARPVFQMINEEQFYDHCHEKDLRNNVTTPFLKSFNDRGLDKDMVAFMLEDPIYNQLIKQTYKVLRDEIKVKKDSKKYLIPSFETNEIIALDKKFKKDKNSLSAKELVKYKKAYDARLIKFAQYYDKHKIFYFSLDELNTDEKITLNSALINYINNSTNEIEYDDEKKIVYNFETEKYNEYSYPILEVITRDELEKLKEQVYKTWLNMKTKKFGR